MHASGIISQRGLDDRLGFCLVVLEGAESEGTRREAAWVKTADRVMHASAQGRHEAMFFRFFASFLCHSNEEERAEVIFGFSRHVLCENKENCSGKQWSPTHPLTLSKPGFFWAPKTKGGGGTLCPPSKNPVTLLRIHSSKLFLKACPKMNLLTQFWLPWKPWLGF